VSPPQLRLRKPSEISASESLDELLTGGLYQGYTYSYPHKTSYRWFDKPRSLREVWSTQDLSNAFLYAHIPFCEMRCGFCNLFTTTDPSDEREELFIDALERQARIVNEALGDSTIITTGAIGGGTPTILSAKNLERLFETIRTIYRVDFRAVPVSVETSPDTADATKVHILADAGVDRVSIGIQSWFPEELRAMGRPQNVERAHDAVARLRASSIPTLSIDLIYGVEGQTSTSMRANIAQTLQHEPDEVFLYPLYVRPLTGLGRNVARSWDDDRRNLYRVGRDALLSAGFRHVSMRRFERAAKPHNTNQDQSYDCQRDPMIGLGPGARSYTSNMHYSTDWAVGRNGVRSIIDNFIGASNDHHGHAHYGVDLTTEDRQRRFVLQGLLHETGLDLTRYENEFAGSALSHFGQLHELVENKLATMNSEKTLLHLTMEGLEFSDAIGPWLYSPGVRDRMADFEIR
jgi:oxygen-independent coproporphyrinogen III oxidase